MSALLTAISLLALLGATAGLASLSWHGTHAIAARTPDDVATSVKGARSAYYFAGVFIAVFILASGASAGWNVPLVLAAIVALLVLAILARLFSRMVNDIPERT